MDITVYTHVAKTTEVSAKLQENEVGKCAVFSAGDLTMLIHSREKLLEISSVLENAAQKWNEEEQ